MEILVGIYIVIGISKTINRINGDPASKPVWMSQEKNPLAYAILFTLYSLMWPFL